MPGFRNTAPRGPLNGESLRVSASLTPLRERFWRLFGMERIPA